MKYKYKKLKAILLAGTITVASSSFTGCGSQSCSNQNSEAVAITQNTTIHFDAGQHIISVPISKENDIRLSRVQYEYHPGYEPIGISMTAGGFGAWDFAGGAIIYTNTEEVECSSNSIDKDGNYICRNFGKPVYYYNEVEYYSNNSIKEFGVGEHIISVPMLKENRLEQIQYKYHEGYEVVGIAISSCGTDDSYFGGGALLYKNITPVQCTLADNGYTIFGKPIESEKTKSINENIHY